MSAPKSITAHEAFALDISMRSRDAMSCCAKAVTVQDVEHHFGVLMGLQWAALGYHEYAWPHGPEDEAEWLHRCGVSSGDINATVERARAALVKAVSP